MIEPLQQIASLTQLDDMYDAVICDAWGVIHNGVKEKPGATFALEKIRSAGKPVIILTNAPRTETQLISHFTAMGVSNGSYDRIISSGEVGRQFIMLSDKKNCYHLGPEIDRALFESTGANLVTSLNEAEFIFNSGLRDNTKEAPENYLEFLKLARALDLPMICVNPDRAVHIGGDRRACAGALAEIYESLGGEISWFGKPYREIYEFCDIAIASLSGKTIPPSRILAIGDALPTDILGAQKMGYQTLFIVEGIHADDFISAKKDIKDPDTVKKFCENKNILPDFFMQNLI